MHKICTQHKKIILFIIYMQSFVRGIIAQNEYELAKNRFLLCLSSKKIQVILKSVMNSNRQNSYEKELENGDTICNRRLHVLNKV